MSFGQWKPTITLKYQPFPKQACIHKIINEPIDSNPQDDIYWFVYYLMNTCLLRKRLIFEGNCWFPLSKRHPYIPSFP